MMRGKRNSFLAVILFCFTFLLSINNLHAASADKYVYVTSASNNTLTIIDTIYVKVIGEVKLSSTDIDSSYVGSPWGIAVF